MADRILKEHLLRTRIQELTPVITKNTSLSDAQKTAYVNAMAEVDEKLQELETKSNELELRNKEIEAMQTTLANKAAELAAKTCEIQTKEKEFEILSATFADEKAELTRRLAEFEKRRDCTRYSTKDISSFLNKTINDFNTNTASDSNEARYIINSMDVDFKVRVLDDVDGDGETDFKFVAPQVSETSEESLSSIKISIQAVPK